MTIKAFSREYLQNYIASELIAHSHKYNNDRGYYPDMAGTPSIEIKCPACSTGKGIFKFTHPSQAPETDLICECGYKVIEYDKDISNSKEYGCKKDCNFVSKKIDDELVNYFSSNPLRKSELITCGKCLKVNNISVLKEKDFKCSNCGQEFLNSKKYGCKKSLSARPKPPFKIPPQRRTK